MSYFYGRVADYESLFEMDQDGVVRPCDEFQRGYADHLLGEGHTVDILSSCKTGLHPLYDCEGRKHFVLHKHYDRTFFHNVSDDTVWCLPHGEKRAFHCIEDECPLWDKITEAYEGVRKTEQGWKVFARCTAPGYPVDKIQVPGIDCNRYALCDPMLNGAS